MGRRFDGPGIGRRGARDGSFAPGPIVPPDDLLGASLHAWFSVSDATVTRVDGFATVMSDLSSFAYDVTAPSDPERPTYVASGGPHNRPYLDMGNNTALCMRNTAIALSAGRRLSFYSICALDDNAAERVTWSTRDDAAGTSGNATSVGRGATTFTLRLSGETTNQVVGSEGDTNWHIFSQRSIATGNEGRKDGIIVSPIDFSGSEACRAIESIWIGRTTAASGGKLAELIIAEDVTAAEDLAIMRYLRSPP